MVIFMFDFHTTSIYEKSDKSPNLDLNNLIYKKKMRHLKLFEAYSNEEKEMIDNIDDIAAYLPTHTSNLTCKYATNDFDKVVSVDEYEKIKNKSDYLKFYTFNFGELSNFFKAEKDIKRMSKSYGLNFFIICFGGSDRSCNVVFMTPDQYKKVDQCKTHNRYTKDDRGDVLFEEDVKIEENDFNIIYEDDDIMAVRPKTYQSAIKYSADSKSKFAFTKNIDWIKKYMSKGSYYGGVDWYKNVTVKKEITSWWRKILGLPKKESEVELKKFYDDFPRYILYIVIFKRLDYRDQYSKLHLVFDVSRGEYGELYRSSYDSGQVWGRMLDAAHNNLRITNSDGNIITLKDIYNRHYNLFNVAFREIERDYNSEKEKLENLLGIWANKGAEYEKDALVFIRGTSDENRLQVTKPDMIKDVENDGKTWTRLGYYDDPNFDYWDLDKEKRVEKEVPNNGNGFPDFYQSMQNSIDKLHDALENTDFKL